MTYFQKSRALIALAALPIIALSGCAGNSGGPSTASQAPIRVAYLSASSANTYLHASREAMNKLAAKENVKITEFDGKFTPATQTQQLENVVSSGQYKGIIIAAIDGVGIQPAIKDALAAGIKIVVMNQVIGTNFDTSNPQVKGISASILTPPRVTGERLGKLTNEACGSKSPCTVAYMYGQKGLPYDTAVRQGFDSAVGSSVKIIGEGEGGFLGTDQPLKATQDILQAHPKFDVLAASSDQDARGAALAFGDANITDIKLIGVGGSSPALTGIKNGTWFGSVALAPADEGRVAFQAVLDAVRKDKNLGGADMVSKLPDDGLVTKGNLTKFTAQWAG